MDFTPEKMNELLSTEEDERIERKAGFDHKEIRQALIAFANDQAGRGGGYLIIGQAPNKEIRGIKLNKDEAQLKIADIAKDQCRPTIPVSIEVIERDGKRVVVVEVRASPAKPHFHGDAWVRVGSQTRRATDAEIVLLRASHENRKLAILKRAMDEGKKEVIVTHLQAHTRARCELVEVTVDWVVFREGAKHMTFPWEEIRVGFDYEKNIPEIRLGFAT